MNYITGGSGFVGKELLKNIDAVSIPYEEIDNIKLEPFDTFYFLSAYGNMSYQTEIDKIVKANVTDLITILNQIKFPIKQFVYFSTSSVTLPVQTAYSRTKKAAEEILLSYDLPITIIRPYSICGSGEQEKHLIPTLIRATINDTEINLSSGSHDFIDVSDIVSGVLNIKDRGIFELGTGISTTNEKVLEIVEFVTGKKIKVNRVEQLRSYDNPDWVCKNPAWKPKKSLVESIKETYEQIKRDTKNI